MSIITKNQRIIFDVIVASGEEGTTLSFLQDELLMSNKEIDVALEELVKKNMISLTGDKYVVSDNPASSCRSQRDPVKRHRTCSVASLRKHENNAEVKCG